MSMKNSIDTIKNRSRDLPVCSAVPQPTAPPRAPFLFYIYTQYIVHTHTHTHTHTYTQRLAKMYKEIIAFIYIQCEKKEILMAKMPLYKTDALLNCKVSASFKLCPHSRAINIYIFCVYHCYILPAILT